MCALTKKFNLEFYYNFGYSISKKPNLANTEKVQEKKGVQNPWESLLLPTDHSRARFDYSLSQQECSLVEWWPLHSTSSMIPKLPASRRPPQTQADRRVSVADALFAEKASGQNKHETSRILALLPVRADCKTPSKKSRLSTYKKKKGARVILHIP